MSNSILVFAVSQGLVILLAVILLRWLVAHKKLKLENDFMEKRTALEAKLEASEKSLRDLYEDASIAYVSLAPYGEQILRHNRAFIGIVGLQPETLVGIDLIVLFPDLPEGWIKVRQVLERVRQGQETDDLEIKIKGADDNLLWVMMAVHNLKDECGVVFETRISLVDISDRKAAEFRLKESEKQFRTLVENIPGVVYRYQLTEPAMMLFVSDQIEKLTGYEKGKFLGEDAPEGFASIIHPDDFERITKKTFSAIAEHKAYLSEYRLVDRDGEEHWILSKGQAQYDEDDQPSCLHGTMIDITDKKVIEEALLEAEKRNRLLLESVAEGIFGVDSQGRVTFINPAAAGMLGYEVDELIGRAIHGLIHHSYLDGSKYDEDSCPLLAACRNEVSSQRADEIFWRRDGSNFSVDYSCVPIYQLQELVGAAMVFHDITVMKQLVNDLAGAKELAESANQAKSDFLANMSHEIRTPMNAIIGMTHLCRQTELSDKQRNYLEKIDRASQSLLGVINDILDFSKVESGKLELENIEFELDKVLENLYNLIGIKAREKDLELLFDCSSEIPPNLLGDPLRLGQVLINLANNAVKFTDQGEVVITVRVVDNRPEEVKLQFSVMDTGIGISLEQQKQLFHPFSQADASMTRKYGGTGLGLVICKSLIELMGGDIWITSKLGEGSIFHFTVWFGYQTEESLESKRLLADHLQYLRVLVVDDNTTARDILSSMLSSFGFIVRVATSGLQGINLLVAAESERKPFQLVLVDWKMPGLDGFETVRMIRENSDISADLKIIMVTAYGREEVMLEAHQADLDGFLLKPITSSLLLDNVMEAFGQEVPKHSRYKVSDRDDSEAIKTLVGSRILLVEDNEINYEVVLELLQNAGMQVKLATDGRQAVEMVKRESFDGVLMDIQMPVMDGYKATRIIREQEKFKNLPIIAMTANAMAKDREKSLLAGMNDHIAKPIKVHEMLVTMARWITPGVLPSTGMISEAESPVPEVLMPGSLAVNENLKNISGLDVVAGLATVQGNEALYHKLLNKFRRNQDDFGGKFRQAQALGDRSTAERLIHTLKGVAGNLGAFAVQKAAQKFEVVLREECKNWCENSDLSCLIESLKTLEQELDGLFRELDTVFKRGVELEDAPMVECRIQLEDLRPLFNELDRFLADDDTRAVEVLEKIRSKLSSGMVDDKLLYIEQLIAQYNFSAALTILRGFVEALQFES